MTPSQKKWKALHGRWQVASWDSLIPRRIHKTPPRGDKLCADYIRALDSGEVVGAGGCGGGVGTVVGGDFAVDSERRTGRGLREGG